MKSPEPTSNAASKHLTIDFLASLMDFCSKHAKRFSKKLKSTPSTGSGSNRAADNLGNFQFPPKSPMRVMMSPRRFFTNINKATAQRKNKGVDHGGDAGEERFGDGGVWQRSILMGDRCQPLDFPGVIYYDSFGRRMDELPVRSPRASPLPGYLTVGRNVEV